MSTQLQELINSMGGGSLLNKLADVKRTGKNDLTRGSLDSSVWQWYDSQVGGKNQEQVQDFAAPLVLADNKASQSAEKAYLATGVNRTPEGAVINDPNDPGQLAYNQRLAAMATQPTTGQGVPAMGTTAYTNYLLGGNYFTEGKGGTGQLKPFIPSTTLGSTNMPSGSPPVGNVSDASALATGATQGIGALEKMFADQRAFYKEQEAARQKTNQSFIDKYLSGLKSPAEARTEAQAETGIDPKQYFADQKAKIAEIETLTKEYNEVKAQKDAQIALSYDKLASTSFINNQIGQIERNAAPKLAMLSANVNAKAATLEALQGNFNSAQNYVNQAVQDATSEAQFRYQQFNTMYSINKDSFDRLDSQYRDAFLSAKDIALKQWEFQVEDKRAVGKLIVENPQAGISITDTLDAAYAKIGQNPHAAKGDIFGSAEGGYFERYYDPKTNSYKTRSVGGGDGGSGGGGNSTVDTYAQAYLDQQIEITSVPQNLRARVLARANEIAKAALAKGTVETLAYTPPNPTIYNASRAFGQDLKPLISGPASLIKGAYNATNSFISGLFGR